MGSGHRGVRRAIAVAATALGMALFVSPRTASAGRTDFGWLFGTEVMPERGVELQTWVYEQNGQPGDPSVTGLWWAPVIGITDQLELSLPVEAAWTGPTATDPASFTLTQYGVDVRYRLVSADPVAAGPVVPLVRLAVEREIGERDAVLLQGDFVLGYQTSLVHLALDVGALADLSANNHLVEIHPGIGASFHVTDELRLGGEAFAQLQVADGDEKWAAVGPNLAWTHGRFWLSAAFGIGVYHIQTAPKVVWGIAF